MPAPRVLVLHNEPTLPPDHPDAESEVDVLALADVMVRIFQVAGLTVGRLGVVDSAEAVIRGVRTFQPDVVCNLYEGTAGWGLAEAYVAGVLDLLRVPYTGSSPQALFLARSKPLTKRLLVGAGIPTAPYFLVNDEPDPTNPLGWPVIVKPGREDASVGIDQNSVCTSQAELIDRVGYVRKTYGPGIVVEKLIVGRELHAAVIASPQGPRTLALTEIFFPPPSDGRPIWPIVTYDAKWRDGSRDFLATPYKNPADVTPELEREVGRLAVGCFELFDCRDYARIDFRVDEAGRPFVLEVNPNPCIAPGAGVAESLASSHIPYPKFVLDTVRAALRRGRRPELADAIGSIDPEVRLPHTLPEADSSTQSSGNRRPVWNVRVERGHAPEEARIVLPGADDLLGQVTVREFDGPNRVFEMVAWQLTPGLHRDGTAAILREAERYVSGIGGRILLSFVSTGPKDTSVRLLLADEYVSVGEISEYFKSGYARLTFMKALAPVVQ